MKRAEFNHRLKQMEYLEQVNHRFEALRLAFIRFNEIWQRDSDLGLDLNNYLTTMYPFPKSFDEFLVDFALWYGDGASKIVQARHELHPRLSIQEIHELADEPDVVEENWAKYDTDETNGMGARLDAEIHISEERMKEINRLRAIVRHYESKEKGETKASAIGLSDKIDASLTRKRNRELTEAIEVLKGLLNKKCYLLVVWGDVEPELYPTKNPEDTIRLAKELRKKHGEENGLYWVEMENGNLIIDTFAGTIFDDIDEPDVVEEQRGEYNSSQTSMFTIEQMKGTGQLNILDQINEVADTKRRLRSQPVTYWTDNGHGWFEVSYTDLVILNVHLLISKYSYRNRDEVYLEEDSDIVHYIKAIFGESFGNDPAFHVWKGMVKEKHEEDIFIRKLKHYYR